MTVVLTGGPGLQNGLRFPVRIKVGNRAGGSIRRFSRFHIKRRSFVQGEQISNGKKDFGYSLEETKYGLAFKEQWERALELDQKS